MIEVNGLRKSYGEKQAVRGISFRVDSGEIVGLLGLNGAGKSTTMNCLTGCIAPTAGTITVDGHDIVRDPMAAKKLIGYLPEVFAFYPDMRVEEYLDFVCDLKGVTKDRTARREHIHTVCRKVGVEHMASRMIRNLSKGYKQRVGFAQALIGNPRVLILDEPTVGLDPSQVLDIRQLVRDAGKESLVIVSSHILSEIQTICSRVIILRDGEIAADASTGELKRRFESNSRMTVRIKGGSADIEKVLARIPEVSEFSRLMPKEPGTEEYRIVGRRGSDIREGLFRALAAAELPLLNTYGGELSLEDIFLQLTGSAGKGESR